MKTRARLILLVILFLYCGNSYGQDEFITLTSSQLLKGLNDSEYLKARLMENGFALVKKWKVRNLKSGLYEYWEFRSVIFLDKISSPKSGNYIIVRIHKDYSGLPDRLIETFPHKTDVKKVESIGTIKRNHFSKETSYSLRFSKEGQSLGVLIWFEDPFYFFQYFN